MLATATPTAVGEDVVFDVHGFDFSADLAKGYLTLAIGFESLTQLQSSIRQIDFSSKEGPVSPFLEIGADPVSVAVRVEDGRGGSDEQQFTIDVSSATGVISGSVFNDLNGDGVRVGIASTPSSSAQHSILLLTGSGQPDTVGEQLAAAGFTVIDGTFRPGQIASVLASNPDIDQVWVWNDGTFGNTGSPADPSSNFTDADLQALADFNKSHPAWIMDGLAWRAHVTAGEQNLTENEAIDLAGAGGGIVLGADDASGAAIVQHVNQVAAYFHFDTFAGVYSTPNSTLHQGGAIFNAPNTVDPNTLASSTATYSEVPNGLQPNGLDLATAIFGSPAPPLGGFNSPSLPDATFNGTSYPQVNHLITTTIPGGGIDPVLEQGLEGWTVYLDENQNGRLDPGEPSTVTDAQGNYTFPNLPAGTYTVAEVPQAGWLQTAPTSSTYLVTLGDNQSLAGFDFGNHQTGDTTNRNPVISSTPPTSATAGQLIRYDIAASDPDGDPLTFDLPTAPAGMTIQPTLGTLVWVPTDDQIGTFPVVVRVEDGKGGITLQTFQVTVTAADTAPVVTSAPPGPATAGLPYEYTVRAQDAENDPLSFSLKTFPAGMTIDAATGTLTWTPTIAQVGAQHVTIVVDDGHGGQAQQAFDLVVAATSTDTPPTVAFDPRPTAWQSRQYTAMVEAADPDGDPLTYTLVAKPDGMTIDATGLIRWTPTAAQFGAQSVELVVSDGRTGGDVTRDVTITVVAQETDHAPVVVSTPKLRATVGREYSLALQAQDEDGDPFTWSLATAPRGMSVDPLTGALRWTPGDDQMGAQAVVVKVQDALGASSTQSFTIDVACVNLGPTITSTPPTTAAPGAFYFYAVRGIDPENDPLTYSLLSTPPAGMSLDPMTGVLHWTPAATDAGATVQVAIKIDDGQGNVATQSFALEVATEPAHQPPVITSTPVFHATLGKAYSYDVIARDPSGDALTFTLRDHPDGMTIDPTTGVIGWTPGADQAGSQVVTIVATDPAGGLATQSFSLLATANQPPVISSTAPAAATVGAAYRYDVRATDPDGDLLTFALATAPAGMTIDSLGRIAWTPTAAELGPQSVVITVGDGQETTQQTFTVTVQVDTQAPRVSVTESSNRADLGTTVTFHVSATDNVGVTTLGLQVSGQPLSLDATGSATLQVTSVGALTVTATAADAAGNVGAATTQLRVVDPNATTGATVEITSPAVSQDDTVTYLTPIIGSVNVPAGDVLDYWVVEVARADQIDPSNIAADNPAFTEIARGTTAVANGVLANFDPTLLANDQYVVRVKALDVDGAGQAKAVTLNVEGEAKLGNFHLEFTDLSVPIAGVPITITRVYDSLQANQSGDFGYGWTLGVRDADIRETVPAGTGFAVGTRVFLTDPSGKRVGFTFDPIQQNTFFGAIWTPQFTADPGVNETLTVDETQVGAPGSLFAALGGPYNPDAYTLTTPDGLAYRYSQADGLQKITDRNGNTLTFTAAGIFSSVGVNVLFTRDGQGRITQITDPNGNPLKYKYDAQGNLIAFTDQIGNTTKFSYKTSPAHYLDTVTDPLNRPVARAEYDAQGRLIGATDGQGNQTHQSFDPTDFTGTFTDGDGNVTLFVYNARGDVVSQTDAAGDVTLYEYGDPANPDKETKVTDPNGNVTSYTYDARGNVTSVTDALGATTYTTYDDRNNVTSTTDALGNTTTYVYDANGNLLQIIDPTGASRTQTRDDKGRVASVTDSLGNTTLLEYDPGCPCGSPDTVVNPDGTIRHYEKNDFGQVTQVIDEDGNETDYTYNAVGELTETKDANGGVTLFGYDADGNQTSVTDPDGNVTTFEFDANHHVIRETDPLGNVTTSLYDGAGNLVRQTDGDGRVIAYQYDAANRVIFERWYDPYGTLVRTIASTYDAAGNLLTESDPDSTVTRTYDALKRIVTESNAGTPNVPTVVLTYRYDANGNVISTTDNTGVTVAETYDSRNLVTSEAWSGGGIDPMLVTFGYNADGQQTTLDRYTDLAGTQLAVRTVTAYTNHGLTASITDTNPAGTVIANFDYTYDALGLVHTFTDSSQTATYGYDKTGQLLSATYSDTTIQPNESYSYDANGNRTIPGYVVGKGNQVLSDGTYNYGYDQVGNLVQKTEIATGNVTTYIYDFHNQLVEVDERSPGGIILNQSKFVYDILDRRIAEIDNGTATFTMYNGENAWADFAIQSGTTTQYLFAIRIDQILAQQQHGGSGISWFLGDKFGTVHDLTAALGSITNQIVYNAFGYIVSQTNPSASNRFSFTGREYDARAGLYYFRARYYIPLAGRFASEDPIQFNAGDPNLYRLGGNDPTNRTDPSGLDDVEEEGIDLEAAEINGDTLRKLGQAKRELQQNTQFRRWFHKVFKEKTGIPGGGVTNPDLPPLEVLEAFEEWIDLGSPSV